MKKHFILLLAFFAIANLSMAQVSLIPKAGVTIANVALDDDNFHSDNKKNMIGFTGGLGINFALTEDEFLSLQPEILYVQKGFAAEQNGLTDYEYTYKLDYLEVPVLLKIGFGGEVVRGYVNLGPSVGYLLSGNVKGEGDFAEIISEDVDEKIEFTDSETDDPTKLHANRIEFGANFGAGLGVSLGGRSLLFVDARYNAGLTDFNKDSKSKNQPIYLTAGFKIPITGR
jgi:hypothetical protein